MQKDLENVTCKEVSLLRASPSQRKCLENAMLFYLFIYLFFSHCCVTLHFACTCLFLSWMCSLDPNRAGNAHDMQSARVQGVHRQWDDCHSGPDGQSYGDLWPRVLGRLTSETPLLLLAAENIKCFWSPTPVSPDLILTKCKIVLCNFKFSTVLRYFAVVGFGELTVCQSFLLIGLQHYEKLIGRCWTSLRIPFCFLQGSEWNASNLDELQNCG